MKPKLSVCMVTYNHENFIKQAIESVLMQKTNFSYELVIGEDCSTDKTKEIVIKYQNKYPNIIKTLINNKNLGAGLNFIQTLKACKSEYIALLEGDDYWTDPYKLQKQVDFLENNPDFTICFHNAKTMDQISKKVSRILLSKGTKEVWSIEDLLKKNFIPTLTCVFRNKLIKKFPKWYFNAFPGDWPLHIFNACNGKIRYIDEVMATYRIHKGGATNGSDPILNDKRYIKTFKKLKSYLSPKYHNIINQTISNFYFELSQLYFKKKDYKLAKKMLFNSFRKNLLYLTVPKMRLLLLIVGSQHYK